MSNIIDLQWTRKILIKKIKYNLTHDQMKPITINEIKINLKHFLMFVLLAMFANSLLSCVNNQKVENTGSDKKYIYFKTDEGTWMNVDISPDGQTILFDLLGDIYTIPVKGGETRAHSSDLSGAKDDLNVIRSAAGLENTSALTQDEILEAILRERQLELFTEFGHRFFDLKRFNRIQSVLSVVKPGWDAHDALFPIPEAELNLNPNLQPQNQGY